MSVKSYGALKVKISCLNTAVSKEKLLNYWLSKENETQSRIISQLKSLLTLHQTKPGCIYGHRHCKINHLKYNLVRHVNVPRKLYPMVEKLPERNPLLCSGEECGWISKLCRTSDKLQSKYGIPPSNRDLSEDDVCPELFTIWENVLSFNCHVLDNVSTNSFIQTKPKPKSEYRQKSVILESRPFKFSTKKTIKKPKAVSKVYEPMTDAELAKALSIEEIELAEAFGYHDNLAIENVEDGDIAIHEKFDDDNYAVDTDGLCLLDDEKAADMYNLNIYQSNCDDDVELAAAHGYHGQMDFNESDLDNVYVKLAAAHGYDVESDIEEIAAAHGYHDAGESNSSLDDDELAAAFGYGSGRSEEMSNGDTTDDTSEGTNVSSDAGSSFSDGSGGSADYSGDGYDATDDSSGEDDASCDVSDGSAMEDGYSTSSG